MSYLTEKKKSREFPVGAAVPESDCKLDCHSFSDWGELRAHFIKVFRLEDAIICLQADYVGSQTMASFEKIEVTEIDRRSVVLSMSVGRHTALTVHFARGATLVPSSDEWPPRADYRKILSCANDVYRRSVRDRVVDLMSTRGKEGVVSFFLDSEGRIESASGKAKEFCERHLKGSDRVDGYFPVAQWDYVQEALQKLKLALGASYRNESSVFSLHEGEWVVSCLLQKLGLSGYLLSIAVDP